MPVQKITREEITRIAAGVFRLRGYHNTSMSDLAEACGLTKGLFYHYFSGKEELMKAVLEGVHMYFKKTLFAPVYGNSLLPEEKLQTFLERAQRLFRACFKSDYLAKRRNKSRIMASSTKA